MRKEKDKLKKHELQMLMIEYEAKKKKCGLFEHLDSIRKGNKLRHTFVDIGLSIADKWAGNKLDLQIYRRRKKRIRIFSTTLCSIIILSIAVTSIHFASQKFRKRKIKKMVKLQVEQPTQSHISNLAIKIISNFSVNPEKASIPWTEGIPPHLRKLQQNSLKGFYSIANIKPGKVWIHKKEKGIYYAECKGLSHSVIFRLKKESNDNFTVASIKNKQ